MLTKQQGPGCIKKLKIKWEMLQLFPVFRRFLLHLHCVSYTLSPAFITALAYKRILQNTGNGCRNSHLIPTLLYATEPRLAENACLITKTVAMFLDVQAKSYPNRGARAGGGGGLLQPAPSLVFSSKGLPIWLQS